MTENMRPLIGIGIGTNGAQPLSNFCFLPTTRRSGSAQYRRGFAVQIKWKPFISEPQISRGLRTSPQMGESSPADTWESATRPFQTPPPPHPHIVFRELMEVRWSNSAAIPADYGLGYIVKKFPMSFCFDFFFQVWPLRHPNLRNSFHGVEDCQISATTGRGGYFPSWARFHAHPEKL